MANSDKLILEMNDSVRKCKSENDSKHFPVAKKFHLFCCYNFRNHALQCLTVRINFYIKFAVEQDGFEVQSFCSFLPGAVSHSTATHALVS
jgi:hypothetical protein